VADETFYDKNNYALIFILTATTFAQSVAISSSDGSTADASAILDVKSTTKGS
jgi:hypothetical protein